MHECDLFTKAGSGQTQGKLSNGPVSQGKYKAHWITSPGLGAFVHCGTGSPLLDFRGNLHTKDPCGRTALTGPTRVCAPLSLYLTLPRALYVCVWVRLSLSLSLSCAWYGIGGGRYPMNHSALPNGSHHASPSWVRDVPLIFNVEFDPSGT
jgi:hypothetical protein